MVVDHPRATEGGRVMEPTSPSVRVVIVNGQTVVVPLTDTQTLFLADSVLTETSPVHKDALLDERKSCKYCKEKFVW